MASIRSPVVLPAPMQAALAVRSREGLVCPEAIEAAIVKIPFLRVTAAANREPTRTFTRPGGGGGGAGGGSAPAGNRFTHLAASATHVPDGWRTNDDSFDSWTKVTPKRSAGGPRMPYRATQDAGGGAAGAATASSSGVAVTTDTLTPGPTAWKSSRYQSLETKIATESLDDRIMGKIRGKINKIGESTYPATKAFMCQILDSGETGFLEEFMDFVFQKAATESSFCALYARLLHELADEFGHLRTEMIRRFQEYTQIFVEAKAAPDVGTENYAAFVEAQSKKKFRRGYSQFVTELVKLGEIPVDDFRTLIVQIVRSISESVSSAENRLLTDELVDCQLTICRSSFDKILRGAAWMGDCLKEVDAIVKSPRSETPGLTNKAMFALMDLQDLAKKGGR